MPLQLTRKAQSAIIALRDEFRAKIDAAPGIMKPPSFWSGIHRDYEERLNAILRAGMEEVTNDRDLRIACPECKREGTVRGTQVRWTCVCSPRVDRYTFQTSI